MDIAERERYQPNQLAQALIRSRQRTHIGMVIPSVGNPFFDEVLRGAQSRARKLSSYGTTLTIREIKGYDAATQLQAMRRLVAEGVDALAVMPLDVPEVAEYLQSLPIPVVTVNTDIDVDRVAFVGCDYYNSGMITGDLVQLMLNGRGRVAAVIGSTNVRGHMDRVRGLRTALESTPEITVDAVLENQDDDDVSYQVLRAYLADHTPGHGVLCRRRYRRRYAGHPGKRKEYPRAGGGRDGGRAAVYGGRAHCRHCDPGALRPGGRGGACAVRLYPHRTAARRRRGVYPQPCACAALAVSL